MKTLIIDDDMSAILALANELKRFEHIQLIGTSTMGEIGVKLAYESYPELIFLDMELPDMTGIEFLQQIKELITKGCQVVIYSAHDCYMLPAFRNNAFDYLIKPLNINELDKLIKRVEQRYSEKQPLPQDTDLITRSEDKEKLLFYTSTMDFRLIHLKDICLFQYNHDQRSWEAVVANREEPIKLKRMVNNETLVAIDSRFIQVSQRFVININYLWEVKDQICKFYPPFDHLTHVKVGRQYRKKLIECFNAL